MKKLSKIMLCVLLLVGLVLSGCTKKENADNGGESQSVAVPEDLLGYYYEQVAGRGALNIEKADDGANVTIDWSSSAFETAHWEMHTTFDGTKFNYKDGVYKTITFDANGNGTEKEEYKDGTGYFEVKDGSIVWHDDKKQASDQDVVFLRDSERAETIGMPNPWLETDDLNAAIKNAGVEFDPPIVEALPVGEHAVSFSKYISSPGTLSVLYEGEGNEMMIRKSNSELSGAELAGDYNTYSKTWEHSFKGLKINLAGDGTNANLAWFDNDDHHYSILFNAGQEGKGLTMDEINSLVMGMESGEANK